MSDRQRLRDKVFNFAIAFTIVVALIAVGSYQSKRSREVTDHIDRGVSAIVCVFRIDPTKLPKRDTPEYQVAVRQHIDDCFDRYGVEQNQP